MFIFSKTKFQIIISNDLFNNWLSVCLLIIIYFHNSSEIGMNQPSENEKTGTLPEEIKSTGPEADDILK